jgi:hypothetical protein
MPVSVSTHDNHRTGKSEQRIHIRDLRGKIPEFHSEWAYDGKPDLIVANFLAATQSVSVLLDTTAPGAATPSFATQQTFSTGSCCRPPLRHSPATDDLPPGPASQPWLSLTIGP